MSPTSSASSPSSAAWRTTRARASPLELRLLHVAGGVAVAVAPVAPEVPDAQVPDEDGGGRDQAGEADAGREPVVRLDRDEHGPEGAGPDAGVAGIALHLRDDCAGGGQRNLQRGCGRLAPQTSQATFGVASLRRVKSLTPAGHTSDHAGPRGCR